MENLTPLCKIAFKYGTDKCPQITHSYTPYYYKLFKNVRHKVKKLLEMGIGDPKTMKHCPNYTTGASLYMWRDFFPNAQIYGADIKPENIFEDERIKTFICNERIRPELTKLIKSTGSDIDIFIDDGSHLPSDQIRMAQVILPIIDKEVLYIIEDVRNPEIFFEPLKTYNIKVSNLSQKYGVEPISNNLLVIRK